MPIIQPTPIDQLPQPPNPADRSNFNSLAYPFTAALLPLTVQINQANSDMYNNSLEAEAKAGAAGGSATAAAGSANAANAAKTGAETAKEGAETARNGAQSSATAAANSATAANTAKIGAEAARDAAAQSAADAAQSADDAAGVVLGNFGPAIHAATSKGAPADADELAVADSQASWSLKKLTWGNLKASIWAAFKTIATGGSAKDTLGLGTAATAPTVGGGPEVLLTGAYGLGAKLNENPDLRVLEDSTTGFFMSRLGLPSDQDVWKPDGFGANLSVINLTRYQNQVQRIIFDVASHKVGAYFLLNGVHTKMEFLTTKNILTTTGQSTQYPMTQKAVTDAINAAEQYENIQRNAAATGTVSINLASASEFDLTLTGNTTIVFDGSATPAGKSRSFVVRIRQGATARTLTWPASVTWLVVGPITTPAANKICEYVFSYSAESGWFGRIGASN